MGTNTVYYHDKGAHSQHWEPRRDTIPEEGTLITSGSVPKYIWGRKEAGGHYKVSWGESALRRAGKGPERTLRFAVRKSELADGRPYNPKWGE